MLIAAARIIIHMAINASLDLSALLRKANYYYWTLSPSNKFKPTEDSLCFRSVSMHCDFCEEGKTFHLKVEGDVGADAIWCDECYCNLDLCDIPISEGLKAQLTKWMQQYGEWMDWSKDLLLSNGVQMEDEHNKMGELLAVKVGKELGEKYKVRFSPSSSARMYANFDS